MNRLTWCDPKRVEALVVQWAAGVPSKQIGKALGITKSAVVGKAHRLGLESRPTGRRNGVNVFPPTPRSLPCRECKVSLRQTSQARKVVCVFCRAAERLGPGYFSKGYA